MKKNIICSFGLVKDVARTLYIDESECHTVYPLDKKLGLIKIRDTKSRYTQRFAHLLTEMVVEMINNKTTQMLSQICEIDLGTASIPDILESIAAFYLPKEHIGESEAIPEKDPQSNQSNLIKNKMEEIEASPDKDEIIKAAVDKLNHPSKNEDTENYEVGKTVFYVSCDGTGVPGIKRELEGKNGRQSDGSAKTFETKIGVCFN